MRFSEQRARAGEALPESEDYVNSDGTRRRDLKEGKPRASEVLQALGFCMRWKDRCVFNKANGSSQQMVRCYVDVLW